jgi:alpha-mannosidase
LNYRLTALVATAHDGTLPATHSFVELDGDSVILHAVKKAEDEDALVLRLYEWAGREAPVRLRLAGGIARAAETDLQEKEGASLAVTGGALAFTLKPYEIKSVKVVAPRR